MSGISTRDLLKMQQKPAVKQKPVNQHLDMTSPPVSVEREVAAQVPVNAGIDDRFQPEEEPDYDNHQENRRKAQAFASLSRSRNLFDLLHKDALADAPRVWLVGGGASAKNFDFSKLEGEIVISANRNFELPCTTCIMFMDERFVRWILDEELEPTPQQSLRVWRNFKGPKIGVAPSGACVCQADDNPYYYIESKVRQRTTSTPKPWASLDHCNNTGIAMLKLAWGMGAKHINLIGYDMHMGSDGNQEWFHAGYPEVKATSSYGPMVKRYDDVAGLLVQDGVTVVNYSPTSALDCFTKAPLPPVVETLDKPLVVGFYTLNTPYEQEIKGMEESFRFFGFDVLTKGIPSRESWSANCYHKPQFIKEMMLAHPGRRIIWADADARLRRYPTELIELCKRDDWDIANPFTDWRKLGLANMVQYRGVNREDLSTAFMVLNNSKRAYNIIERWQSDCTKVMAQHNSGEKRGQPPVDDRLMEHIYFSQKNWRTHWAKLPTAYGQIFDLAAGAGVPVVEQLQASRRFKSHVNNLMDEQDVAHDEEEFVVLKEHDLYDGLWESGQYVDSKTTREFQKYWPSYIGEHESVLEVGCGSGNLLRELRAHGLRVQGHDITRMGVAKHNPDVLEIVQEGPIWSMPYGDSSFDHVISFDVLEHLPPAYVESSILELYRVCGLRMTHVVATFADSYNGEVVHKTVEKVQWWRDMFEGLCPHGEKYDVTILDRKEFLASVK